MFKLLVAGTPSLHGTIAARGPHDVAVTASGIGLLACCPDLRRATAEDENGDVRLPYHLVLRLCLRLAGPKLKADKPDEWKAKAWRYLFDPAALGRVLASVYASPHFDSTRVYKTLNSLANALREARDRMFMLGENLDSLLVDFDSMLVAGMQQADESAEDADARVAADIDSVDPAGQAKPELALSISFEHMVDCDGTFTTLATLEQVWAPRFTREQRVADASGLAFSMQRMLSAAFSEFVGEDGYQAAVDMVDNDTAIREAFLAVSMRAPPPQLVRFPLSSNGARLELARALAAPPPAGDLELKPSDVLQVIDTCRSRALRAIFEGETSGAVALTLLGSLWRLADTDASGPFTLGALMLLADLVEPLYGRISDMPAAASCHQRHSEACRLLREGRSLYREASSGGSRSSSDHSEASGDGGAALHGYSRMHQAAFQSIINSEEHVDRAKRIEGVMRSQSHFEAISYIFAEGDVNFIYPLLGKKLSIPGIPLAEKIANDLAPHGASWAGWVARGLLVAGLDDDRAPPKLTKFWAQICAFDLKLDLVNDVLHAVHAYYSGEEPERVPTSSCYASLEKMRLIAPLVREEDGLLAHLGFKSAAGGSLGDIHARCIQYFDKSVGLNHEQVCAEVHAAMAGVLEERSLIHQRQMARYAPDVAYGGMLVIPNSEAAAELERCHSEVGETLKLARQLKKIDPARLGAALGEGSSSHSSSGASVDKAADAKATAGGDTEADAKAKAAALGIGKYGRLAKPSPDGKTMTMGKNDQVIDLASFRKKHPGVCEGFAFSTHEHPHYACNKQGKKGHTTTNSGAHALPKEAKSMGKAAWQALFFIAAATAPAPASTCWLAPAWMGASPACSAPPPVQNWYAAPMKWAGAPLNLSGDECAPLPLVLQREPLPWANQTAPVAKASSAPERKPQLIDLLPSRLQLEAMARSHTWLGSALASARAWWGSTQEASTRPMWGEPGTDGVGAGAAGSLAAVPFAVATPIDPRCAVLHDALAAMRAGGISDEAAGDLARAAGITRVSAATRAAVRAALFFLLYPGAGHAAARASSPGSRETTFHRWVGLLRDLRDECEALGGVIDDALLLPSQPAGAAAGPLEGASSDAEPPPSIDSSSLDAPRPSPPPSPPTSAFASATAAVPTLSPAKGVDALMLMAFRWVSLPNRTVLAVGLPLEGSNSLLWGQVRERGHRDDDDASAKAWASALALPEAQAFYLLEDAASPKRVLHAAICSKVEAPVLPIEDGQVAWSEASALQGEMRSLADLARGRLDSHLEPSLGQPVDIVTGALAAQRLAPQQLLVKGQHVRMGWGEVAATAQDVTNVLREAFAKAIKAVTGVDTPLAHSLAGWSDRLLPPPLEEVPDEVRAMAMRSSDQRLATVPFPDHAMPVATPPLPPKPPPPDQRHVPKWAKDWQHVWLPQCYHLLVATMRASRAHLRAVGANATGTGPRVKVPPKPPVVALGPEALQPWARAIIESGEHLVFEAGRISILDRSAIPPSHFNAKYIDEHVLDVSEDYALRDALISHGMVFTPNAGMPPYMVLQQNLESLADGFDTVHSELHKMRERGWYRQSPDRLDSGLLDFDMVPSIFNPNGAVPRALSNVFRRILDGYAPRQPEYVLAVDQLLAIPVPGGALGPTPRALQSLIDQILKMRSYRDTRWADRSRPLTSVNEASGMTLSRRANRALLAEQSEPVLRVSSAQKKRQAAPRLDAAGRAIPRPMAAVASFPLELKPYFADLMLSVALLSYVATLLPGEQVVILSDDYKSFFHQFMVSFGSRFMFHILALDPDDVANGRAGQAALAVFGELCMGMGICPSSNYAQRFATELSVSFERRFHKEEAPFIAALEARHPAFARYAAQRRELAQKTGRIELKMCAQITFTDDPRTICLMGPEGERCVRVAVCLHKHYGPEGANVLLGDPVKRYIGVYAPWIGGNVLTVGNLAYMSPDKMLRTQVALLDLVAGKLTADQHKQINGLLEHVVGMGAHPRYLMADMYASLDAARKASGKEPEPRAILEVTPKHRRAALKWLKHLGERSGCSLFSSIFEVQLPASTRRWVLRCDAAVEGTEFPAICGALYSYYYVHPLDELTRALPICALEFAGQGFFNLTIFDALLPAGAEVLLTGDALVAAMTVAKGSKESALLKYMHDGFVSSPAFARRAISLSAVHEYGVGNPVCDHGSRGRVEEMLALMRMLGLRPKLMHVLPECTEYLRKAAVYWQRILREREASGDKNDHQSMHATAVDHGPAANGAGPRTPFSEGGNTPPPTPPTEERRRPPWAARASAEAQQAADRLPVNMRLISRAEERAQREGPPPPSTPQPPLRSSRVPAPRRQPPPSPPPPSPPHSPPDASDAELAAVLAMSREEYEWKQECERNGSPIPYEVWLQSMASGLDSCSTSQLQALLEEDEELQRARGGALTEDEAIPQAVLDESLALAAQREWRDREAEADVRRLAEQLQADEELAQLLQRAELEDQLEVVVLGTGWAAAPRQLFARRLSWVADIFEYMIERLGLGHRATHALAVVGGRVLGLEEALAAVAPAPQEQLFVTLVPLSSHSTALSLGVANNGAGPRTPFSQMDGSGCSKMSRAAARRIEARYALLVGALGRLQAGREPTAAQLDGLAVALGGRAGQGTRALVSAALVQMAAAEAGHAREAAASVREPGEWETALANDTSSMALCPGEPGRLHALVGRVQDALSQAFAATTNKTDAYHFKAWARVCALLNTPAWRTDAAANSGADPVGHRRELMLLAIALVLFYMWMKPRSKRDPVANPRSALAKLHGVAREHKKRGYVMAPLTLAVQVMKGMLHNAVRLHGTDWLAPERKRPLTNAMISAMLALACGTSALGFTVDRTAYFWVSAFATFAVLAETGMRKADVSKPTAGQESAKGRLTFASLTWEVDGVPYAHLTRAQLAAARVGYACYLVYGALKNDPFAEFYGSRPSKLEFSPHGGACKALVELELAAGLQPGARASTPLFGPRVGVEWHHDLIDRLFKFLLRTACGLSGAEARGYSVHSFRIYLACALYAAGCPNDRIQAILRWKSEDALLIYARLNDAERSSWVAKAQAATVDSKVAAYLPTVDGAAAAAALLEADNAAEPELGGDDA